jgi:glycosyltransferase involved in cell wall biosynthesis
MSNPTPKVSIGMPVFNGEIFIKRAINSLLAQSFKDFELIISDNASDDLTQVTCLDYVQKDSRVIYLKNDHNVGALANFHNVLQMARAEIFFWAPHDDQWDYRFIESAVTALDRYPDAVGAMGRVNYLNLDGERYLTHAPPYGLDKRIAYERAYAYFSRRLTDNLMYGVYRTKVLRNAPFKLSLYPEKLIILHLVLSGPVINVEQMQYSNHVSFKSKKDVVETLLLSDSEFKMEAILFIDLTCLLYKKLPLFSFPIVFLIFVIQNNWHKFFLKKFLLKFKLFKGKN